MKLVFTFLLLFGVAGCAQKNTQVPAEPGVTVHDSLSFLKECSQVRIVNANRWLLTCQKAPHADRTEIYDWSFDTQKLKRITYQDGQIWDIAPIDDRLFYYSSSYDEFKEQFVSILSGAQAGSDIYIKDRLETDFKRLTAEKGLEVSLFWNAPKQELYYVYQTPDRAQIKIMNHKKQSFPLYNAAKSKILSPIFEDKTKTLFWVEYNDGDLAAHLKSLTKPKKPVTVFKSASKIFQISFHAKPGELLVGFATAQGVEIWAFNPTSVCWKLASKVSDPVSEFYVMNESKFFVTIKNSIKQISFLKQDEACQAAPPGLGVPTP